MSRKSAHEWSGSEAGRLKRVRDVHDQLKAEGAIGVLVGSFASKLIAGESMKDLDVMLVYPNEPTGPRTIGADTFLEMELNNKFFWVNSNGTHLPYRPEEDSMQALCELPTGLHIAGLAWYISMYTRDFLGRLFAGEDVHHLTNRVEDIRNRISTEEQWRQVIDLYVQIAHYTHYPFRLSSLTPDEDTAIRNWARERSSQRVARFTLMDSEPDWFIEGGGLIS